MESMFSPRLAAPKGLTVPSRDQLIPSTPTSEKRSSLLNTPVLTIRDASGRSRPQSSTSLVTASLNATVEKALRIAQEKEKLEIQEMERKRRESMEAVLSAVNTVFVPEPSDPTIMQPSSARLAPSALPKPPPNKAHSTLRSRNTGAARTARSAPSGKITTDTVSRPYGDHSEDQNNNTMPHNDINVITADVAHSSDSKVAVDEFQSSRSHIHTGGGVSGSSSPRKSAPSLAELAPHHSVQYERAWAHRDDVVQKLHEDTRLGYNRRVVPVALVQTRIDSLIRVYRENEDGALEMLSERIKETYEQRSALKPSHTQDAIKEAVDEATHEYLSHHPTAREVPYAILHNARQTAMNAAERIVKSRSSPDAWKLRNESRLREQRSRLVHVEQERQEALQQRTQRHAAIVAAAEAQRIAEARAEMAARWLTWIGMALAHKSFVKQANHIRTYRHLESSYTTLRRYWDVWAVPAAEEAAVKRRLRLMGKRKFALCAVRLLAYHLVRKRNTVAIITLLRMQLGSQKFITSVHNFCKHVRVIQRVIRRYLALRRSRLVMLLIQWDAYEADMRHPTFSPLFGKCVAVSDPAASSVGGGADAAGSGPVAAPATHSSTNPTAPQPKQPKRGKGNTSAPAVKSEEAIIHELATKDKIEQSSEIPFDVRLEAVKEIWFQHRRQFFKVDQPGLLKLDTDEYMKALAAFRHLPPRRQIPSNEPKKPRPRSLPLFVRRSVMLHHIQPYMDALRGLLLKVKTCAAKEGLKGTSTPGTVSQENYKAVRDSLLDILYRNEDASVKSFEGSYGVSVPRFAAKNRSTVVAALDDKNEAMNILLASSPRLAGGSRGFTALPTPNYDDLLTTSAVEIAKAQFEGDAAMLALAKHVESIMQQIEVNRAKDAAAAEPLPPNVGKAPGSRGGVRGGGSAREASAPASARKPAVADTSVVKK